MARKPVLELTGRLSPRDRVWTAVRKLKFFTYQDIADAVDGVSRETIEGYVRALDRGGFLERKGSHAPGQAQIFELVRDAGIEAPRLNGRGERLIGGDKQQALWNAMRILKTFTLAELVAAATTDRSRISAECAKKFVRYLRLAQYVTLVSQHEPSRQAVYRFLPTKYTGPRAPVISAAAHVYDPNLGQVVWHPEEVS